MDKLASTFIGFNNFTLESPMGRNSCFERQIWPLIFVTDCLRKFEPMVLLLRWGLQILFLTDFYNLGGVLPYYMVWYIFSTFRGETIQFS